ncbi:hypothetical protein CBOM_07712 [Ceraceosorus bombacis]|uniref:Uncharacterized protein n=1 Tax=Ceraceosorus bombacis TaxID=401625 RepID=A0A0P1B8Y8_9BASI|nr:hypothetical protein CBOM_07712 [Ceraceosorus bombacis]
MRISVEARSRSLPWTHSWLKEGEKSTTKNRRTYQAVSHSRGEQTLYSRDCGGASLFHWSRIHIVQKNS